MVPPLYQVSGSQALINILTAVASLGIRTAKVKFQLRHSALLRNAFPLTLNAPTREIL